MEGSQVLCPGRESKCQVRLCSDSVEATVIRVAYRRATKKLSLFPFQLVCPKWLLFSSNKNFCFPTMFARFSPNCQSKLEIWHSQRASKPSPAVIWLWKMCGLTKIHGPHITLTTCLFLFFATLLTVSKPMTVMIEEIGENVEKRMTAGFFWQSPQLS